ncbi:MAG: sigma-54 dependent transcriptional regulator [Pseudomonadota bacterium]
MKNANPTALIIDDEPDIRELLEITLGRMGLDTVAAADVAGAKAALAKQPFELCLTDMNLPDGTGLEIVDLIGRERPELPVAVITAFGSMETAISALKCGAFDFLQKPVDIGQLRALVETALRFQESAETEGGTRMIGESSVMESLRSQIRKLARSQAPIYISGESGSGKELAARLIHEQGPRAAFPFVPVNCGAIPSELMESEFFGHRKGSFTGAVADKEGLFEAARGGTLFLDEVADLPLSMQVKLLRAIQEKAVRAIGAQSEVEIDVRVLSATHKNLGEEVRSGRFRQDLYYRLNVINLEMPPLRKRGDDVLDLAHLILDRLARDYSAPRPELTEAAIEALMTYEFPGNVRELENLLERAFTLCENQQILPADLNITSIEDDAVDFAAAASPAEADTADPDAPANVALLENDVPLAEGESLEDRLETVERALITRALEANRWNKTAAAKDLGITFRALRYRLKKLDME